MRIAIGADHAGFTLKDHLRARLAEAGHELHDFGAHSEVSVDYPDFAAQVARAVAAGSAERGILVCGSGIGMAIAANRPPRRRAPPPAWTSIPPGSPRSTTTPTCSRSAPHRRAAARRGDRSTSFSPPHSKAAATSAVSPSWTETVA